MRRMGEVEREGVTSRVREREGEELGSGANGDTDYLSLLQTVIADRTSQVRFEYVCPKSIFRIRRKSELERLNST